MVLQDLDDAPPDDDFGNGSSPNDHDISSSGRRYDASQLPQPIPVLGPFLGFSNGLVRFKVEQTLKFAEQKVHRPLTTSEAQALAYHLHKLEQTKSYFSVLGVAAGVFRAYTTMAEYRYPFYKPKVEDVNPNKFLFIRGPLAQTARQSWRFMLYGFIAGEMGKIIGQIIAQPLAASNTAADPALSQFTTDLRAGVGMPMNSPNGQGTISRKEAEREAQTGRSRGELPPHAGAPRRWAAPRRAEPSPAAGSMDDDMSPTADGDAWSSTKDSFGDANFSSNAAQESSQTRRATQRSQASNAWGSQSSPVSDEDASPTGGLFQDEVQNQSKSGESAWERLRHGAAPTPGQRGAPKRDAPPRREHRDGSALGDGFTSVETDEERRKAQEKAQSEFDERIERERQGKDFHDERRW